MRFITALTTACLLLLNGVTAIDNFPNAVAPASGVSPMLTRLAETIQSTQQQSTTPQQHSSHMTDSKPEQSQTLIFSPNDPLVITPINITLFHLPDLVGKLSVSDEKYPIVYPPKSIGIQNKGNAASQPCKAKLSCVAWGFFPPRVITSVTGADGETYGICFSDMTFEVPSIAPGAFWYPTRMPWVQVPISCRKPAGMCDIHWTVDTTNVNAEWNKNNNNVVITKTTVAPNPPNWP